VARHQNKRGVGRKFHTRHRAQLLLGTALTNTKGRGFAYLCVYVSFCMQNLHTLIIFHIENTSSLSYKYLAYVNTVIQ